MRSRSMKIFRARDENSGKRGFFSWNDLRGKKNLTKKQKEQKKGEEKRRQASSFKTDLLRGKPVAGEKRGTSSNRVGPARHL